MYHHPINSRAQVKTFQSQYAKASAQHIVDISTVCNPQKTVRESPSCVTEKHFLEVCVSEEGEPQLAYEIKQTVANPSTVHLSTSQTTLLSYKASAKANYPGSVITLENIMDAISGLSLKVDSLGEEHHATLERLVFEDCDIRTAVLAMRESMNIYELTDALGLPQFYYDEESETDILRCLPCFKVHLAAKPTLSYE